MSRFAKERNAIHIGLLAQGIPCRYMKNGIIYYLPGNVSLSIHGSISDGRRAFKNLRASCLQQGVLWPLDPNFPSDLAKRKVDTQVSKQVN